MKLVNLAKQARTVEIRQSTIYITLGFLDDWTNELSTKSLMFQVLDLGHSKLFIFIFVIL